MVKVAISGSCQANLACVSEMMHFWLLQVSISQLPYNGTDLPKDYMNCQMDSSSNWDNLVIPANNAFTSLNLL